MAGPLTGIRVIDFTAMISGPLATMTLADQGADVVKVEPPGGGDHARNVATRRGGFSASFVNNNRNKRSVVLDLKHDKGLEAVRRLIGEADVLVQNFRPGVMDRIGLGEAAVRALNPKIVYVSIAGFGFEGPYAQKPVFDPLIQAVSGLTTVQAGSDEERPRLVRTILPDKLTAIQASQAIVAALFARERTGEGQHVTLSMLDTLVSFLWSSDMSGHTFIGEETEIENAQSFIDLIYETADGYVSVAIMRDREWTAFAELAGHPEWADDDRFRTAAGREVNKNARLDLTQQALRNRSTDEWLTLLEGVDIPCAPVLSRRAMRTHPQVAANKIVVENVHSDAGPLRQTRPPARFSRTEPEYRFGAPRLGQHTEAVLREAGYGDAEIEALLTSGAAWQDIGDAEAAQ
ncbi:MAG: CoA transferase [Pseudomonadota bacterium]